MGKRRKFILADVAIYILTHLLDLIYCIAVVCINPDLKRYWTKSDYIEGWVLLCISVFIYCFIVVNYYKIFKKIGLGFIYSIITELIYILMNISMLTFYTEEWNITNISIIIFSFTGLPILFIIIAIIYFAVKKKKETVQKSGE